MASELSSVEGVCEGDDCEANADLTFYVKEKKKLCHDCASKMECLGIARKGMPYLYCEKHDKHIDMYCKTHCVGLCVSCAVIDHHEKPCVRQDLEDAIMEIKAKLNILKKKAMEKLELCRVHGKHIRECRQSADEHLQSIKEKVDSVIEKAIASDKVREQEDTAKIDQEIDGKNQKLQEEIQKMQDKIRENDEERKKRHDENNTNADKRQEPIQNKQCELHADIQTIAQEIKRKVGELEKSWQDDTKSTENASQTLDSVLEDDQNIVKDGHRVNTSVSDTLKKPLNEDEVKEMNRVVSGVRFVKGAGREMKYDGRIDGYDGEWKLIDTINVTNEITYPIIVGCMDGCNIIITDRLAGSLHTYMLNLNTKHIQRVINGGDTSWVMSCAVLNDDKVVCGRAYRGSTGDSLNGCISVYGRQWKLITDVTIPRNTTGNVTQVNVAADKDGMIIAAEVSQSKIYVIDPADGKSTITCKEKIRMCDMLSSGHFIARPSPPDRRALIIDREGAQREIPHNDVTLNVCVDPNTEDLYVMTSDEGFKTCVIDQVMSEGAMKKRRVASFPLSTRAEKGFDLRNHLIYSRVMMTSSGKMIACDRDNILVFRKLFSL
ncbi:uncharacterized protein LOC105439596 [Strongylocentrotus purpuratus]|uniref:B box-type domain-containing protein n=1 Tax=Strongylocentrotus purpuratus TaxID=7668 RepID=A0A7M7LSX3_STRPU|nr:uncharacterized protein LOC105439596 [Strongylocentrotus purpuratus]|eukprot:XP_011667070.1 PREDICTED: uncharacterized protein LOC105439596 [Strongylocentrotus purpuratus]